MYLFLELGILLYINNLLNLPGAKKTDWYKPPTLPQTIEVYSGASIDSDVSVPPGLS